VFLQGTRRAPALPVSFSVFVTVLAVLTSLGLIYRVLINAPDSWDTKPAAYLGLVSAFAVAYGGYRSMREEERSDPARTATIRTVHLDESP
jgi:hypothetical protein